MAHAGMEIEVAITTARDKNDLIIAGFLESRNFFRAYFSDSILSRAL